MTYKDIKNQQDACKVLNREVKPGQELKDIADAINFLDDNFKPKKDSWFPLFWWDDAGGFGFSDSYHGRWLTNTDAGARLGYRFRSEEISDYFGSEFMPLHKELFYS